MGVPEAARIRGELGRGDGARRRTRPFRRRAPRRSAMARLDAARLAAWRDLQSVAAALERRLDAELVAEWQVPLASFDVLGALQRAGRSSTAQSTGRRPAAVALEPQPSDRSARGRGVGGAGSPARHGRPSCRGGRADPARSGVVAGDERQLPAARPAAGVQPPRRRRRRGRAARVCSRPSTRKGTPGWAAPSPVRQTEGPPDSPAASPQELSP